MLQMFASHKLFIAIDAAPAPRKIPLMRKSIMITRLAPKSILAYVLPIAMVVASAPIKRKISGANTTPVTLIKMVTPMASHIVCTAACAAQSLFFSPIRRATVAVAAMLIPIAME